ncbi:MAG TPA: condensation domain-containing protein, partial [Thermoanaerobaculia bacterium]|nr:condensation domain-containing protein [Thermoanaerobaculia bacterium]
EYALAQLWMAWGIRPQSLIGHSLGEYSVACLAGVLSLADALALVALRGRLFETLPQGAMLGVPLSESDLRPYLQGGLSIAAVNLPGNCVVSGLQEQIRDLHAELGKQGIEGRMIQIEVAAHSPLVEPILDEFGRFAAQLSLHPPAIPFVSNLTGTWITDQEATNPQYWRRHLRETVRFADGIRELLKEPERILLEVGPGRTLATLARRHPQRAPQQVAINSLRHPDDEAGEVETLLGTAGQLWLEGCEIDWQAFQGGRPVHRVPLPSYPFEHERYWANGQAAPAERVVEAPRSPAEWLLVPSWERVPLPPPAPKAESQDGCWLFFGGSSPLALAVARQLADSGRNVVTARPGEDFGWTGSAEIALRPEEAADYHALLDALEKSGRRPERVIHAWCLESEPRSFESWQALGFESLRHLGEALEEERLAIDILTCETQQVLGGEALVPAKATVLGWCEEIPRPRPAGREFRSLDVALPAPDSDEEARLAGHLAGDLARGSREAWIAYRGGRRWVRSLKRVRAEALQRGEESFVLADGGGELGEKIAALLSRIGEDPERPRARLTVRSLAAAFDPAGSAADRAAGHLAHATAILEGGRELVWDETLLNREESAEEALRHALALPEEARIVISSRDLPVWLASRAMQRETGKDAGASRSASNRPSSAPPYVAPGSDLEKALARIWEDVLGISPIGIHDRFNSIGGDSVLAIQAVSRAQQMGLPVTHRMAYLNNTIADLAIAVRVDPSISAKQGMLTGPVPLLPIQRWFLEDVAPPDPHHWNIDVLLETREDTDPRRLEAVLGLLELHHDSLRLRFAQGRTGWTQRYAEPDSRPFFHQIDLSALPAELQGPALAAAGGRLQRSLDLAEGPLMRAAYFHRGAGVRGRLLIVFHHLVTDAVSLPIFLEDLESWYGQLESTGTIVRPAKTSAFGQWTLRISDHRGLQTMEEELGYWLSPARESVRRLPVDHPDGLNTMGSMQSAAISFTAGETDALLREAPRALDADVPALLLTALSLACERWSGERALLVDMEGHGREPIYDDFDFSRTIGWFTSSYPLLLDRRDAPDGLTAQVLRVREQIRAVPNRGLSYGLLRYSSPSPDVQAKLRALPSAEVIFRYLSQTQRPPAAATRFGRVGEPRGESVCPQGIKRHLLDISAQVFDGRLHLHFWYSKNLYLRSTVEGIADAYRQSLSSLLGA